MLKYFYAGGCLMWVIAALSVIALAVVIERLIFFARASADPEKLEAAFGAAIASGDREAAGKIAGAAQSSMHRLFFAAYSHWRISGEAMKLLAEQQVRREVYRWEKHIFILEIVGKTAPLLGLLGTVLGMVEMFRSLHMGGAISASAVTGGIWKALFTTVAGLAVAIPTIFAHGLLVSRIDSEEETLKRGADFLIREHFSSKEAGR